MALGYKIPFGIDGASYRKGLGQLRKETKQWSGGIKGAILGAFAVGAITSMFSDMLSKMDRIHKLSERFGASMKGLQQLDLLSELNGTNLEQVAKALVVFDLNAVKASDGTTTLERSFERLKINADEIRNLDLPEQMIELSRAYIDAENSGTGMADLLTILGTRSADIIPLLKQGPEALRAGFESASVASDESIKRVAKFNDRITEMKQTVTASMSGIFSVIMGAVNIVSSVVAFHITTVVQKFDFLKDQVGNIVNIIGHTISGNFEEAGESVGKFAKRTKKEMDLTVLSAKNLASDISDAFKSEGDSTSNRPNAFKGDLIDEGLLKARQKLIDAEKKAKMELLSVEEKITALYRERNELAKRASDDSEEGVKAKIEILELDKKISDLSKKQEEEAKAKMKIIADGFEEIAQLSLESDQADEERRFNKLSDSEKLAELNSKKLSLDSQIEGSDKNKKEFFNLKSERRGVLEQIDSIESGLEEPRQIEQKNAEFGIVASSLASIGGGGGVMITSSDPMLEEAKNLRMVVESVRDAVSNISGGNQPKQFAKTKIDS